MKILLYHLSIIMLIAALSSAFRHDGSFTRLRRKTSGSDTPTIPLSFEPLIPDHCRHQNICDDVPNYPQDYVDHLLGRNSTVYEAVALLAGHGTPKGCLNGQDPNDVELCPSEIEIRVPKAGKDTNGQWHFLVGEHWLCIEKCKKRDEPCASIMSVPTGYRATCQQKKILKRTVVLDKNGTVKYSDLPIESACCCHVRQNTGYISEMFLVILKKWTPARL